MALILALLPTVCAAGGWTPETLPMVHLRDARRYVCNPDDVLSPAAVDTVDAVLARLERDKGVQSVVVAVDHLEGDDPYEFGMALGRRYGIGSRTQNTGLIVILAVGDRSYQILTGSGLEGVLPDALCRRVENRVMLPALKDGQWDTAIVGTVGALDGILRGQSELTADEDDDAPYVALGVLAGVVVIFAGFLLVADYVSKRRRCPRCGHRTLRQESARQVRIGRQRYLRSRWRCRTCGHEETKDQRVDGDSGLGGGLLVPPIFPGGSGRGGGGGFTGGSFGGGLFGGGGSGGRF